MRSRPVDAPEVLSGAGLPAELADLDQPPAELFLWGRIPAGPRVAIVGTRKPSRYGFEVAFRLARLLGSLGMTVVSGGALGIDRAAHLGALRSRAPTLVVAPVWKHHAYPKENRELFDAVLAHGGGYVTRASRETQPFALSFHVRNELLVAFSDIVVLGEMGVPSGGLSAAKYARKLSRPRFVLPWLPESERTLGVQAEFERGAIPYFRVTQLLRRLEGRAFDNPLYWERSRADRRARPVPAKPSVPSVQPEADPVVAAIQGGATTVDAICEAAGLDPAVAQHRVLLLTLEGRVYQDDQGLLRARAVQASGAPTKQVPDKYPTSARQVWWTKRNEAPLGSDHHHYPTSTRQVLTALAEAEAPLSRAALQEAAGLRSREHFLNEHLRFIVAAGLIELTIPQRPQSSKQAYRLTQAGRELLERGDQ